MVVASESGSKAADAGYVVDIPNTLNNNGLVFSASQSQSKRTSVISDASTLAATYRDSFDEDDDFSPRSEVRGQSRSVVNRVIGAVMGVTRRKGKGEEDYFGAGEGLLKERRSSRVSPPREVRRCRRSYVGGLIRRALLALPVVMLALLGLLHIAEFLFGRHDLFWGDFNAFDEYLPNWGKSGYEGEGLAGYPTDATRDVMPIACHSHNDYWRRVPFFDAIHWGCTGVEADVWLFDEELYVGHNTGSLTKNRTFRNLYVNPIVDLLDRMNVNTSFTSPNATMKGIFDADPDQPLILLVDFKTNGKDTYEFVHKQLSALREKNYLTYHDGSTLHQRPVTVVGTGNTPFNLILANSTHRDIFFDAPLDRLYESSSGNELEPDANTAQSSGQGTVGTELATPDDYNPSTSYYASVSFTHAVGFIWRGRLSQKQMNIIRGQIRGAHRRGLKVRYWDTPSWPVSLRNHVWHVLMREGADMLNVDDLQAAAVENWKARNGGRKMLW